MSYDNTNTGVLFKNDKKGNYKAPDYKGKIDVDGRPLEIAAWIREGRKGKFMSLKLSEPMAKQAKPAVKPAADDFDSPPF